jgi:hypothetical protein
VKTCTICKQDLPLDQFHAKRSSRDGHRGNCKACRRQETMLRYREWRERILEQNKVYSATPRGRIVAHKAKTAYAERNREATNAKQRLYRRTDTVPWMLYNARLKSKRRGWDCDLTMDDIILPDRCPVLGIPLMIGDGKMTQNSPSLDRIDNAKGYVKGNVIVVSLRANAIKNDATVEELGRVFRFYRDLAKHRP